jgi:hypothetical protein
MFKLVINQLMTYKTAAAIITASAFALTGCVTDTPGTSANGANLRSNGVPLQQAMDETIDATLSGMEKLRTSSQGSGGGKFGLALSEVEVTFNVTVTKTNGKSLGLSVVPASPVSINGGLTRNSAETNGNTIRFKFSNVLFADKNTVLGQTISPVVITNGKKDCVLVTAEGPRYFKVENANPTPAPANADAAKPAAASNEQIVYQYMTFDELWAMLNGNAPKKDGEPNTEPPVMKNTP